MSTTVMSTTSQPAATGISNLLFETGEYGPPKVVLEQVLQKNWEEECRRSLADPEKFWEVKGAAIGIPDRVKGESIKAFVTTRAGHVRFETLASQLIEHVRRELGPIAEPSAVEFAAGLPKTRSGKILRRFLKAKEAGQDVGDISTMEQ